METIECNAMAEKHDTDKHRHAGFERTPSTVGADTIADHGVCVEPLWRARPPGSTADMTKVDIADPFARQLMARYLSHRQEDLSNMRAALASDDFEQIKITGHNMHGSGSAYGLDRISELGRDIENAAIIRDATAVSGLINALENFVRTLSIS